MTGLPLAAATWSSAVAPILAHGHLPESAVEWVIFVVAAVTTVWVLWKAVRYTMRPGETEPDHVKRSILDDDRGPAGPSRGSTMPPASGPST